MLIDFHTHAFPDKIAVKALAQLAARAKIVPETDGTISDLLKKMDIWHVDKAVVCNIATNPGQQTNVNNFAIETKKAYGDRLIPLGSVHPNSDSISYELQRIHDAGIPGVKLHPDYMHCPLDSAAFTPILDMCADLGLFVIIHAGYDVYSPDKMHATADMILTVLQRHPRLKLVCAHYGNNCMWDDVEEKLVGKPLWIDCSMGCKEGLSPLQAKRILDNHDSDKILFGSDAPWCSPLENINYLQQLDLSPDKLDKLFWKNAAALLDGTI